MKLFDTLLARVAPYECLACGAEDSLLCANCRRELGAGIPSRCYVCTQPTSHYRTCDNCRKQSSLQHVVPCYPYAGLTKLLIKEFKFNGKRGAARDIAREMRRRVVLPEGALLVPIPTSTGRIRERGYDHIKVLTAELARTTECVHLPLLARISQKRQLGAGRSARFAQIEGAFRVVGNPKHISGAHIILIDDVVTTGATLEEAARTLLAAGARRVDALVFAQTLALQAQTWYN